MSLDDPPYRKLLLGTLMHLKCYLIQLMIHVAYALNMAQGQRLGERFGEREAGGGCAVIVVLTLIGANFDKVKLRDVFYSLRYMTRPLYNHIGSPLRIKHKDR